MKGKAKWDAWTAKKGAAGGCCRALNSQPRSTGVSKEDAMQAYIDLVAALKAKYA